MKIYSINVPMIDVSRFKQMSSFEPLFTIWLGRSLLLAPKINFQELVEQLRRHVF